jgi:heme/copper-type cytochrome/quinol oxidase subunit 2
LKNQVPNKTIQSLNLPDDARMKMVKRISKLMDEEFSIGKFKFGLDPILNLIPFAGDISGYVISVALIITMVQYGASGKLAVKMLGNATLDTLVGAIPILGWIFDFTYKANTKNVKLLSEYYTQGKHKGSARSIIFSILMATIIILILVIFLSIKSLQLLITHLDKVAPIYTN